jgi:hypothetical protein
VTTTKAKVASATTQSPLMTIKFGRQWQPQTPQQQQHRDTHNGNDDNGNKTVAIRQLKWQRSIDRSIVRSIVTIE